MSKYLKILACFILALIIFLFQYSFLNSLPGFLGRLNLILFLSIWFFIFRNFRISFYFSISAGIIMDIFSFYPFGLYSFSFLTTIFLANFIWQNFFTNRSIYSFLALSFSMTLFFNLFSYLIILPFENNLSGIFWFNGIFWLNLLKEIIWMLIGIIISFYFLNPKKGHSEGLSFEKHPF